MKKNDSPAFPFIVHEGTEHQWHATGLTKREYFSLQCLQGMLAGQMSVVGNGSQGNDPFAMAKMAVTYADNLLTILE